MCEQSSGIITMMTGAPIRTITAAPRGRRVAPSGGSSVPVPLIPAGTSGTPAAAARHAAAVWHGALGWAATRKPWRLLMGRRAASPTAAVSRARLASSR
jgi:hypothetical protein